MPAAAAPSTPDTSATSAPRRSRSRIGAGPTRVAVLLVGMATIAGTLALPDVGSRTPRAAAAGIVHVSPAGSDAAAGRAESPVRTVKRAVQIAADGDTIRIASGTYHEEVQVYAKQVHIEAAPGADVVFDGARVVSGWTRASNGWAAPWNTDFARAGAPHTTAQRPEAGWPEQFFVDGVAQVEVTSVAAVRPGAFFHDRSAGQVVIGTDPTGRLVEGSDLAWGVYLNRASGSSLTGLTVRRYATPSTNMAAVRAYADDLRLTNLTIEDNAYMGVSVMGNRVALEGVVSRDNGHLGVHAHRSTAMRVDDAVIAGNNAERFDPFHAAGGLKITESAGIVVTDSVVSANAGPGLWTDLDTTDVVLTGNTVTGNSRSGIELELSARAIVADNVVTGNAESGVWVLETSDVEIWHNAIYDNFRDVWVEDGPRSDVNRVGIVNNTMGGIGRGAPAVVNVDDWTSDRSAEEMGVRLAGNRYWMPETSTTADLSRWADWPYGVRLSGDLGTHQTTTAQDRDAQLSTAPVNPYVRSATDLRPPVAAASGQPLSAAVAGALLLPAGAHAPGPLSASSLSSEPPSTTPTTTTTPTTSPTTTSPTTTTPFTTSPTTTTPTTTSPTDPESGGPTGSSGPSGPSAGSGTSLDGAVGGPIAAMQPAVRGAAQRRSDGRVGFFGAARNLVTT